MQGQEETQSSGILTKILAAGPDKLRRLVSRDPKTSGLLLVNADQLSDGIVQTHACPQEVQYLQVASMICSDVFHC